MKRKGIIILISIGAILIVLGGYFIFSLRDKTRNGDKQQFLKVIEVNKLIINNLDQDSTVNLDYWNVKRALKSYYVFFDQNDLNKIEKVVSKYGLEVWGDRTNGILYTYSARSSGLSPKYRVCKAYLYYEGNIKTCPKLDWFLELRSIRKINRFWYQVEYEI